MPLAKHAAWRAAPSLPRGCTRKHASHTYRNGRNTVHLIVFGVIENHDDVGEIEITTSGTLRSHPRILGFAFLTFPPHPSSPVHKPIPTDQGATAAKPCSSVSRGE